jgi:hypothetical protein
MAQQLHQAGQGARVALHRQAEPLCGQLVRQVGQATRRCQLHLLIRPAVLQHQQQPLSC